MPSQRELAEHIDVSTRHVRGLRDDGIIPDPRTADLDAIRLAYIRHLRAVAGQHAAADGLDLVAERARLARAQAERTELQLAERRGELVPADELETALVSLASTVMAKLRGVPTRVAPAAHSAVSIAECEQVIRDGIHAACEAIADRADAAEAGAEE